MYPLLTLAGTLRTWQVRYCKGEFSGCERYRRTQQGREVPANLMPSAAWCSGKPRPEQSKGP